MIRVGVVGARGRMGRLVCRAVLEDPGLVLASAVDRSGSGEPLGPLVGDGETDVRIGSDIGSLLEEEADVAVDFTHPNVVMENVRWAVAHDLHVVVGTTGIGEEELAEIRALLEGAGSERGVIVAPNFAVGAVLAQRFAAEAARFFPAVEIIELHHDAKADAPSGTALATAHRVAGERKEDYRGPASETVPGVRGGDAEGVRVHSVRLPGLVAHQEVILGGPGQVLTIRHDSLDRTSFMPGVLLAIRAVVRRPGLTVGLDPLLDLPPGW